MTHTKALKLALEALELHLTHHEHGCVYLDPAITAIKEALAQPAQEPVCDKDPQGCWNVRCQLGKQCKNLEQPARDPAATVTSESGNPNVTMSWWHEPALPVGTKLYADPPQREWVGLTDEEIDYQAKKDDHGAYFALGALWAEAKLKEKNT